jgi:hypothetical protein
MSEARGRRCGAPVSTQGVGTKGTAWTLKSMYDDDGPVPGALVVGEEFEINTQGAGQHWAVTFSANGTVFFNNPNDISTATGIREVHMTSAVHNTLQHMNAHAVRQDTGEVIDGTVILPPAPPSAAPAAVVVAATTAILPRLGPGLAILPRLRAKRPLRWIGAGLDAFGVKGLSAGAELTAEQFEMARRLVRGQHRGPGSSWSPRRSRCPRTRSWP